MITSHWTTLQNVFKKYLKRTELRELREHKRANRLLSRCGLVGARFAQQCNIFAPILALLYFGPFFADLIRH